MFSLEGNPFTVEGPSQYGFSADQERDDRRCTSFYQELQEEGMPDQTALRLTENYLSIFTARPQEVMEQSLASRMPHKAKHELAEEKDETKKGLGGQLSNRKEKTREGLQVLRRQVLLTKFALR